MLSFDPPPGTINVVDFLKIASRDSIYYSVNLKLRASLYPASSILADWKASDMLSRALHRLLASFMIVAA